MNRSAQLCPLLVIATGLMVADSAQAAITITTEFLPAGRVGSAYQVQLTQMGGTNPTWRVSLGELAPGLQLAANGVILGIPTSAGQFAARIEVSDSAAGDDTADFVLTIDSNSGVGLATSSLPVGMLGAPFMAQIEASGGTAPYGFQIISGAPSWLFMSSDGSMSGTPDAEGMHPLAISVIDSTGASGSGMLNLVVGAQASVEITTTSDMVPPGVVGTPYSFNLAARGGVPTYTWSVNGQLPAGLSIAGDSGIISGTPTQEFSDSVVFEVADIDGERDSLTVHMIIGAAGEELRITAPATIELPFAAPVSYTLPASGGTPPYEWSVTGDLPAGLRLDGDTIMGTATSSVAMPVTITVFDAAEDSARADVIVHATNEMSNNPGTPRRPSSGGGRVGGARRRDAGCVCVEPGATSFGWSGVLLLTGLALVARRRR